MGMLSFFSNELVWAVLREREEDARKVRPHTATKHEGARRAHEHEDHRARGLWVAQYLRAVGVS